MGIIGFVFVVVVAFLFFFVFRKSENRYISQESEGENYFCFSIFVFQNIYLDRNLVQHVHGPYLSFLVLKKTQF